MTLIKNLKQDKRLKIIPICEICKNIIKNRRPSAKYCKTCARKKIVNDAVAYQKRKKRV